MIRYLHRREAPWMTLETLVRSSGPHAPPTTLRAFFDSPGWTHSGSRFGISKK